MSYTDKKRANGKLEFRQPSSLDYDQSLFFLSSSAERHHERRRAETLARKNKRSPFRKVYPWLDELKRKIGTGRSLVFSEGRILVA